MAGWLGVLAGAGRVPPPDPGNTANAPAPVPVQAGTYEFIQPFAFQGAGHSTTDIPFVPPGYQNVGEFALGVYDPSGLGGGGYSNNPAVMLPSEASLYFDASTGQYYRLG